MDLAQPGILLVVLHLDLLTPLEVMCEFDVDPRPYGTSFRALELLQLQGLERRQT